MEPSKPEAHYSPLFQKPKQCPACAFPELFLYAPCRLERAKMILRRSWSMILPIRFDRKDHRMRLAIGVPKVPVLQTGSGQLIPPAYWNACQKSPAPCGGF